MARSSLVLISFIVCLFLIYSCSAITVNINNRNELQKNLDLHINSTYSLINNYSISNKHINNYIYGSSPVYDNINRFKDGSPERDNYIAQYFSYNQNLVGTSTVYVGGHKIDITIYDQHYDPSMGAVSYNMSAYVDGIQKQIHNPFKYKNPSTLIGYNINDNGDTINYNYIESPSDAMLYQIALIVLSDTNGNATFDGIDPTLNVNAAYYGSWQLIAGGGGQTFPVIRARIDPTENSQTQPAANLIAGSTVNAYGQIARGYSEYNTTNLNAYTINSLTIVTADGTSFFNTLANPVIDVVKFTPATIGAVPATTDVNISRFDRTNVYSEFNFSGATAYNFTLNATGLSAFNKSGWNAYGWLTFWDASNSTSPPWISGTVSQKAFATPTYISVIYSIPASPASYSVNVTVGNYTLPVNLNDTSTGWTSITSWNWSFGDGTWTNLTGSGNTSHSYTRGGNFTPYLILTNASFSNVSAPNITIQIYNQTTTLFSVNSSSGVFPLAVNVTSSSINNTWQNVSWGDLSWDNTTSLSTQNVSHLYTRGGNFTLNIYTSDFGYGLSSNSTTIMVENTTVSGFIANQTSGNLPLAVTFNVTTTNDNATKWNWTTNNIWQNGTTQNFTYTYNSFGVYSVTEIASNMYSTNTTTLTNYITVHNTTPTASFTGTPLTGTAPLSVTFTDSSSSNAYWYNWSYGDGTVANFTTQTNPTHSYSVGNIYTVNETVSNDGGSNTQTRSNYISVYSPIIANFTSNYRYGFYDNAHPFVVTFSDTSSGISINGWNWSFGNGDVVQGTSTPIENYMIPGIYTVTLNVSNSSGVYNFTSKSNYIIYYSTVIPEVNVSSGMVPLAVAFNDSTNLTSWNNANMWNWSFGDGSWYNTTTLSARNATHIYITSGIKTVGLTVSNPFGSATNTTTVNVGPTTASFTPNVTIQQFDPMSILFTDTSNPTPSTWNWSFGDTYTSTTQNPIHTYLVANNYTVTENTTNLYESPNATGYVNLTTDDKIWLKSWMQFNNATVIDLKGNAWTQNFGASTSVTNVKSGWGSRDLAIQGNRANIQTPSGARLNIGQNDFDIEFWIYPTSTGTGNIVSRTSGPGTGTGTGWGFSNRNGTVNGYSFWMGSITNSTPGINIPNNQWSYIKIERSANNTPNDLEVYRNGNVVSSINQPTSFDTANSLVIGSPSPGSGISFYMDEFRFDVGQSDDVGNFNPPYKQYNGNLYEPYVNINPNATLTVKSYPLDILEVSNLSIHNRTVQIQNLTNATSIQFGVSFPPLFETVKSVNLNTTKYNNLTLNVLNIDNSSGVINLIVSNTGGINSLFDNRTDLVDIGLLYYNYSAPPQNIQSFNGLFTNASVTDGQHSVTYPIVFFNQNNITFGDWNFTANLTSNVSNVAINKPVQFISTFNGSYPNVWNWSFGDGTYDNGTNSTDIYSYTTAGTYFVNVNESLWQNNSVFNLSRNLTINVYALPLVNFTQNVTSGLVPVAVMFNDTSNNTPTIWNWSFGDGTYASTQNTTHTYYSGGIYTINLTASNFAGNASNTSTVTVYNNTLSGFTANVTTGPFPFNVGFNATPPNDNATFWSWSFGDNLWQNGTTQNATHVYQNSGLYTVTEIANNSFSSNTTTLINYINVQNQSVYSNFTSNITSGVYPTAIQFTDTSNNTPTSWNWSFGDGTYDIIQNPSHVYYSGGNYTVTLNASNINTPSYNPYNMTIQIFNQTFADFTSNTTIGQVPMVVQFIDLGVNGSSWYWDFGDGFTSIIQSPVHQYNNIGNFTVDHEVSNPYWNSWSNKTNYIQVTSNTTSPPIAAFISNQTAISEPVYIEFTDQSSGGPSSWNWSFGNGDFSNQPNPIELYSTSGTYTVTLTVSNVYGSNSISHQIQIYGHATSDFTASQTTGTTLSIINFIDLSTNATQFYWDLGDGTTTVTQSPQHQYLLSGVYSVNHEAYEIYTGPFTNYTSLSWTNKSNYITIYPSLAPNAIIGLTPSPTTVNNLHPHIITSYIQNSGTVGFVNGDIRYNASNWNVIGLSPNTSTYPDNILVSSSINNGIGEVIFNVTRTGGYTDGHIDLLDLNISYINYVNPNANDNWYASNATSTFFNISSNGNNNFGITNNLSTIGNWNILANFTSNDVYVGIGQPVKFNDNSLGNPNAWNWSFGDGNYSIVQSPSHAYSALGQYTVNMTAYLSQNISVNDSQSRNNYVFVVTNPPSTTTTIIEKKGFPIAYIILFLIIGLMLGLLIKKFWFD